MDMSKSPLKVEAERSNAPQKVMSVLFPNMFASDVIKYLGEDIMMIPEGDSFRVDIRYGSPIEMRRIFGWIVGYAGHEKAPKVIAPDQAVIAMAFFVKAAHRQFGMKEVDEA